MSRDLSRYPEFKNKGQLWMPFLRVLKINVIYRKKSSGPAEEEAYLQVQNSNFQQFHLWLCMYSRELKAGTHTEICRPLFIVVSFPIAER